MWEGVGKWENKARFVCQNRPRNAGFVPVTRVKTRARGIDCSGALTHVRGTDTRRVKLAA